VHRGTNKMRIAATIAVCRVLAAMPALADWVDDGLGRKATETERRAFISGYSWGNLRWAQEHCNGSVSVLHVQRLRIDRAVDPAVFDAAADRASAETVEAAIKAALKISGDDAARFGNNGSSGKSVEGFRR
jgi:hypothetical protein